MGKITVYGRATSSNVQMVMWLIGELGLDHDRLDYGHVYGGLDTPEFRAMNPHGLVPVIRDGDGPAIWESHAIMRYLAGVYGDAPLYPKDPVARAKVDMWMDWGKTVGREFIMPIFWPRVRFAAADRDEAALARAVTGFDAHLDMLEAQLGDNPYVFGADFTLADIVLGHVLYRYFEIDIPRKERPVLQAYYDRLCDRPAFRDHVIVDFSPLRHPEA